MEQLTDPLFQNICGIHLRHVKGVVNCQNSRDKGLPEGYSARG